MTRSASRTGLLFALLLTPAIAACDQPTSPRQGAVALSRQGRGADDPAHKRDDRGRGRFEPEPGDVRHGRGADDGPSHR